MERTTKGAIIEAFFRDTTLHVSWMFHDASRKDPSDSHQRMHMVHSPATFVLVYGYRQIIKERTPQRQDRRIVRREGENIPPAEEKVA